MATMKVRARRWPDFWRRSSSKQSFCTSSQIKASPSSKKFETYAKQVGFAVVLLTPDDLGGPASAPALVARARQNVIFELGYFVGKLGRGRACLLRNGEVEIPSDLYGVIYTKMDAAGGWKLKLVKELKAAEIPFNQAKVLDV
jgi:predicted nucleotide-binding protein